MTYSSNKNGEGLFHLTTEEHTLFKAGKTVRKVLGDHLGMATITLKMTRPKSRRERFPENIYGENYHPTQGLKHESNTSG